MQQMAYMGYQASQQTMVAPVFFATSLFPMVPGSPCNRYFVTRQDLQMITGDKAAADFLQDLEVITRHVLRRIHEEGKVPEGYLPDMRDLYVVSSPHMAEERTLNAWGHTKYSEVIPILVKLGFIKYRWVAPLLPTALLPCSVGDAEEVQAAVFFGLFDNKPYVVVDDKDGNYKGIDEKEHNIVAEGHAEKWMIRREFLVCIENVQAAQYALAGRDAPSPMPRWTPLTRQRDPLSSQGQGEEAHIRQDRTSSASTIDLETPSIGSKVGNRMSPVDEAVSTVQDNTDNKDTSTIHQENMMNFPISSANSKEADAFRKAPWCVETILGLSSNVLAIPDRAKMDEDAWERDYGEPAVRIYEKTKDMEAARAWERVDMTERFMATPGSPSWWQRPASHPEGGRKAKRAITLRNIADHLDDQHAEYLSSSWMSQHRTPYDGPLDSPEDDGSPRGHSQIFGGTKELVQGLPPDEDLPLIIEGSLGSPVELIEEIHAQGDNVPPGETEKTMYRAVPWQPPSQATWDKPIRGMTHDECLALWDKIEAEYPELILGHQELTDGSLAISVQLGDDEWTPAITGEAMWRKPSPTMYRLVQRAMIYGARRKGMGTQQ